MDEMAVVNFVKGVAVCASIIGILAGLDLLLGARVVSVLKQVLDKAMVNLDKAVISTRARVIFGILFLVLSAVMLLLLLTTKGV